MRFIRLLLPLILLLSSVQAKAQIAPNDLALIRNVVDTVNAMGDSMIHSDDPETRWACAFLLIPRMLRALKVDHSFTYPFDSLNTVKVVTAPDNSFRIFTWHVELENHTYRHFGAIQFNSVKLKGISLNDATSPLYDFDPHDARLSSENWFGCVYYGMTQRTVGERTYYFLFGYDANDPLTQKKLVDVLYFEGDKAKFGAPMFQIPKEKSEGTRIVQRMILEYNKGTTASISYDKEKQLIVYDHLRPGDDKSWGVFATYMPDGTYEGLEFDGKRWIWKEKVYDFISETPPMPAPIHEPEKLD